MGVQIMGRCREQRFSETAFYNRESKRGGAETADTKRLTAVQENARLNAGQAGTGVGGEEKRAEVTSERRPIGYSSKNAPLQHCAVAVGPARQFDGLRDGFAVEQTACQGPVTDDCANAFCAAAVAPCDSS